MLLVEDDDELRKVLSMMLGRLGFSVREARSRDEALAHARDGFDVVVSDIRLGEGYEGLELVRELRAERDVPAVAITGHPYPGTVGRAWEAGFDAVLLKPFDRDEICHTIARVARKSRAR